MPFERRNDVSFESGARRETSWRSNERKTGTIPRALQKQDIPSVDPLDSKSLDRHHALGLGGIHILEGLTLAKIPPGLYDLIALPLKHADTDGSQVRAVIRAIGK